jgi:hypothetical protein
MHTRVVSLETALHQLVVRVEKTLHQREIALGVFLDIEGSFNSTSYDTMCEALARYGADHTIIRWIRATLEGRQATANPGETSVSVALSKGCPQGGMLSPLLWCLVVDDCWRASVGEETTPSAMQTISVSWRWENSQIQYRGSVGPTYSRSVVQRAGPVD